MSGEARRLLIERVGGRGDGIAADGTVVPGALPGETVRVADDDPRAGRVPVRLEMVEVASPERVAPFCPYYGTCGGCALQHWAPAPYAAWKRARVVEALSRAGLSGAEVAPLVDAHGAGRRRATFHVRRLEEGSAAGATAGTVAGATAGTVAGFMAARSHALVPIASCPITEPALARAPALAVRLAGPLGGGTKPLDAAVTATEAGLDVDLRGHGPAHERARAALVGLATREAELARVSLHGDVVVENRPPRLTIGRAAPVPPPGGFLQATRAGEEALAALVREAVGGARRIADLFCGVGPFALRLAEGATVHAVDADPAALAALERAARASPSLRPVTSERRDLFRRPLLEAELDRFDAVLLDPPRAGAEAQAARLAASRVPLVAMVSCDPASFARDASTLVAGGFALAGATPVDQFKWSPHVEIVGVFRRAVRRVAARRR